MLVRATWIQGVKAGPLNQMAASQQTQVVKLPATRGTIFDTSGEALAVGQQRTTVYADPREVKDPYALARAARRILRVKTGPLLEALATPNSSFVYIARQADPELAKKLVK